MSDTKYCKDCKNTNCPEGRVNCKYPDAIACAFYRDTPQTVFETLTASPEALATEFVEKTYDRIEDEYRYYSMLTGDFYDTEAEAISATVAKLKDVDNDE